MPVLTHAYLTSVLSYNEQTGDFIWIDQSSQRFGMKAGCLKSEGYRHIGVLGKRHSSHRLAWFYHYGTWPDGQIDHIDRCKSNNRISNLRIATKRQNAGNQKMHVTNTSGVRGVQWEKKSQRFKSVIRINGKLVVIGRFRKLEDATQAYQTRARAEFGEFFNAVS